MALIESLSKFGGVEGVVVANPAGEPDYHFGTESPDITASIATAAVQSMSNLGEMLGVGKFFYCVLTGKKAAVFVEKDSRVASVVLNRKADVAGLAECVRKEEWRIAVQPSGGRLRPPPLPSAKSGAARSVGARRVHAGGANSIGESDVKSNPTPPQAHSLNRLRSALYFGDISECMPIATEISCSDGRSGLAGTKMRTFSERLGELTRIVTQLLEGRLSGTDRLDAFCKEEGTDRTLLWAAHIWSARLRLALGDTRGAEMSAAAARRAAAIFDADTQTATLCTLADVHNFSGQADRTLSLFSSGASVIEQCASDTIAAALHLTEAHAWTLKRHFAKGNHSAEAAEQRLPQSPYPKLMCARLAASVGNISKARSRYQEVLKLNPTQPDALLELEILNRVKSGNVSSGDASEYFHNRELAPTQACIDTLRRLAALPSGFPEASGLLVWRLLGMGDAGVGALTEALSCDFSAYRYKPGVVVGYGASCSIAVGYQGLDDRLRDLGESRGPIGEQESSPSDAPLTFSLPPAELRKHMAGLSADSLFSGELKMFSLPDLLEFLRNAHRTGSLLCSTSEGVGAVEMLDGYVSSAIAPNVDTIGAILLRENAISKEELTEVAMLREKDLAGLRIGAILVERGLVSAETIKKAVTEQTFSSIRTMLSWRDGRFLFTPRVDSDVDRTKVEVKLDCQFLLMELFRMQDEENKTRPSNGADV